MIWSRYQNNVFDEFEHKDDNLFINSVAGSGKTETLKECNRRIPIFDSNMMPVRTINTCFNVSIRETLQQCGLEAGTLNSLAWRIYRDNVKKARVNRYKSLEWIRKHNGGPLKTEWLVCRIVSLFKQLGLTEFPDNWLELCDQYGLEVYDDGDIEHWSANLFAWSTRLSTIADFDDQIYQVVRNGWVIDRRDICFIDEAHDLSPIKIEFALQLGRRIVATGDPNQAIYVFAGADVRAVDNIIAATNATVLPLSVCYRCAKEIVRLAQTYVPRIEWCDDALEGSVENVYDLTQTQGNDLILCRTVAPLVRECLAMVRQRRKSFVKGKDIVLALQSIINKGKELCSSDDIDQFTDTLQAYRDEQIDELRQARRMLAALALDDRIETVLTLADHCDHVNELHRLMDIIFADEHTGIEFSTIHRAKGRERERVFIIRPDLLPHPRTPQHLRQIENNLAYVAITRAREQLYFVNTNG